MKQIWVEHWFEVKIIRYCKFEVKIIRYTEWHWWTFLHGESGSADQVYVEIAKLLQDVDPNYVYTMDETGFNVVNYRSIPKRTLGSQPRKGIKEAKDRML